MASKTTMRGWTFTTRGTPSDALNLCTDLARPDASDLQPHEVLVRITHVGIFQGFAALMGILPHFTNHPWIPASDFAGLIVATGSSVKHVVSGDAVFGSPDPKRYLRDSRYNGVLVEYAILPATAVVKKPAGISFASAAGLGGNGCTAVQFCAIAGIRKGQKVLVTGASGSTGSLTLQVAKVVVGKEGSVWGTCSGVNEELVKGLGADGIIDYKRHPNLHEHLAEAHSSQPFDIIIDIAGSDDLLYDKSVSYLKPDGVFVGGGKISLTHGGAGFLGILAFVLSFQLKVRWPLRLGGTPRKGLFYSANINQESLQRVADLVEAGQLKGLVDSEWAMEDAIKAYERVGTSRARGKVIVRVQDP